MASSSKIPSGIDPELLSPTAQSPRVTIGAEASAAPPGGEETFQESSSLPKICNLDWQREGMPDTEFNRQYTPDAWGEEAGPNARVWKIYRDRQTVADKVMLHGWNKTLDVLLIFAALFSAVLTAFLIESYKALQPDYTQYVAVFLYAAAVSHNSTGGVFPVLDTIVSPDRFVQTSATQRWTNGLWFSSLVISLAVALLCILIKQWLDEYDSHVSSATDPEKYRAQRHCMYHRGLKRWGVPVLISFLPFLLHLALFLFFVGLILFIRPLDGAISYSLLALVSCIGASYVLSLFLPVWYVECPSYTPLLAQARLGVSRAISGLLYVIRVLKGTSTHSDFDGREKPWPKRLTRETRTIAKCDKELDGYVLSTLIELPTDGNRDVINSAFASLGAVTSTRTTEVIIRKLPLIAIEDKINSCFRAIPSTGTGFSITSHAQLRRAREVLCNRSSSRVPVITAAAYAPGLRSSLGIDGLLLQALGVQDADERPFDISLLIDRLQSLPLDGDSLYGFPLPSLCLIAMEAFRKRDRPGLGSLDAFLLVFCAGQFSRADTPERLRALRILEIELMLSFPVRPLRNGREQDIIQAVTQSSIAPSPRNVTERELIYAVLNGLWHRLAVFESYKIETVTAKIVAHQALAYLEKRDNSRVAWSQLEGMSTFIRSSTFGKCVGASLTNYIKMVLNLAVPYRCKEPLGTYWECISALMYLGWNCVQEPDASTIALCKATSVFPVTRPEWRFVKSRIIIRGPYATQEDWYEPALWAFLDGPNAIGTWTWAAAGPSLRDGDCIEELASLAYRISIVLCRRKRLGRANYRLIPALFSGSFLLTRFRELTSRDDHLARRQPILEQIALGLGKHCHKLSPESFLTLCAQLEETGDAGSEVRSRAVAFAQRMRNDSTPGGPLSAECADYCACMTESATADAGTPTRWHAVAARFRRGSSEPTTASNV